MSSVVANQLLDCVKARNLEGVQQLLQRTEKDLAAPPTPAQAAIASSADADGSTALHWASWVKEPAIFALLVASGASVNARNSRGESVLEWAIRGGSSTILSTILLSPGVDLHSANAFGGTAAHIAAEEGSEAILAALYLLGAPIDAPDSRGKTPLHCAAHRNRPGALQWLLRHGADAGKQDEEGASALHYAAIGGNEFNCDCIIKAGMARVLDQPAFSEQLTPAELASKYQQDACAGFLRRWKTRAFSAPNRFCTRVGLDRPRDSRPAIAWPQIYFFIGITWTLYHFATVVTPTLLSPEYSDLGSDSSLNNMISTIWLTAILAMIGMGGFMYLDPGFIPKGPKLSGAEAQAPDGIVAKALGGMSICAHCRIIKPIRSKHCHQCGGCVARMDHHCPWVNSCVGLNNHRSFFGVIISMLIAAALHSYLCFYYAFTFAPTLPPIDGVERSVWDEKMTVFLCFHSCVIVLGCSALLFGQAWTVSVAMTTNEAFNRWRYPYLAQNDGKSPFNEGRLKNCLVFWGFVKGKSFVRSNSASAFSYGARAVGSPDIILEMESRAVAIPANNHGHSHGGQPCHGHGGNELNRSASPITPTGSLNLQALLNPPHNPHSHHHGDQDPECAYFDGVEEPQQTSLHQPPVSHQHQHQQHHVEEHAIEEGNVAETSGLISGKDKHH